MSWSITAPSQTAKTLAAAARAAYGEFRANYRDADGALAAMDEQFEATLAAGRRERNHR